MKKRIVSLLLAVCMLFCMMSSAFAETDVQETSYFFACSGRVNDNGFTPNSRPITALSLSLGGGMPVQFFYGTPDNPGDPLTIEKIKTKPEGIVELIYDEELSFYHIEALSVGETTLYLTIGNDQQYELPVSVKLPNSGFYTSLVRSTQTLCTTFEYSATNNTFYFILDDDREYIPQDAKISVTPNTVDAELVQYKDQAMPSN